MANVVLIPGAGGDPWFWHLVDARLRDLGHDVVAVDLPGPDPMAGLARYVDLVVEAAAGWDEVTLVGQSLGGFTAAMACEALPVSHLVYVNAMIPNPGETAGDWWGNTGSADAKAALDAREGRPVGAPFDADVYFLHDVPAAVLATGGTPRDEGDAAFITPVPFTAQPDVPTHVVVGRDDRFFPAEFQTQVARERLGIEPVLVPGGHLAALSHPAELTALLASYVTA